MAAKKSNFYLTREQLIREIILSKQKQRQYPEKSPAQCFTPNLTNYLVLMVNKYANKGQWRSYSYLEDMKSDALLTLCQNAFKYNEEKYDNPFGYYTQIIKYCFITFLEKEELLRDIKDSLWESIGMTPSYARQIKNEMMKDVVDQSSKGLKAVKKDVEILNDKINVLSSIANRLWQPPTEIDIDTEIAETLELEYLPYTTDLTSTLTLFIEPPDYIIERQIEIAGQLSDCLCVTDASTKSITKRVLPDTNTETIVLALCSIGLAVRRDLLVKRLREISGYNITSTHIPAAEKIVPAQTDVEDVSQDAVTTAPRKKPTRKVPIRNAE